MNQLELFDPPCKLDLYEMGTQNPETVAQLCLTAEDVVIWFDLTPDSLEAIRDWCDGLLKELDKTK